MRARSRCLDRLSNWKLANTFGDPRLFQILFLGILLAAGAWLRDFSLSSAQIILTFVTALTAQHLSFGMRPDAPRSYRSAIITALSLTLLLRADNLWVHPIAACAAILSKSLLRVRGKHLFNPATFGVIFAMLMLPGVWISPGQWGQDIALAGWMVALGAFVVTRARRADISWSFLLFYVGALAMRIAYLGQRWAVLEHQLANGALLLFAFFMISDPMTSPNHPRARAMHAAVVAAIAFTWQFGFYAHNGMLWALFLAASMVPMWDALFVAPKYRWSNLGKQVGGNHEQIEDETRASDTRDTGRVRGRAAA
ncbi:MAG TPA: RnfABCDGE type electron transport complex subunit D [Candidatus Binataceae bacterium]|nr:RnfABCDGE type electron transport complex subunit D [Candidatus Binataceae bacterium]